MQLDMSLSLVTLLYEFVQPVLLLRGTLQVMIVVAKLSNDIVNTAHCGFEQVREHHITAQQVSWP